MGRFAAGAVPGAGGTAHRDSTVLCSPTEKGFIQGLKTYRVVAEGTSYHGKLPNFVSSAFKVTKLAADEPPTSIHLPEASTKQ